MIGCVRICAGTQGTVRVIHVVHPLASQCDALREVGRTGEPGLYHAIGASFVEQCAEIIELREREGMLLTPLTAWKAEQFGVDVGEAVDDLRTVGHEAAIGFVYRACTGFGKDIDAIEIGTDGKALAQINDGGLLIANVHLQLVVAVTCNAADTHGGEDEHDEQDDDDAAYQPATLFGGW
jgi:hypothetical protein